MHAIFDPVLKTERRPRGFPPHRPAQTGPKRRGACCAACGSRRQHRRGSPAETARGKRHEKLGAAAMQALGSYQGGKMLFLGLGTGNPSATDIRSDACNSE